MLYKYNFKQIKTIALETRVKMEEPALMELIPTSVVVNQGTVDQTAKKVGRFQPLTTSLFEQLNIESVILSSRH